MEKKNMSQEMQTIKGENNGGEIDEDDQKWVYDSSVDYKGKIPLRASTGVWKASLFIITIELSERLSYFGIATNLITYLTQVMHQDLNTAAKNVNYWAGVTTVMPLLGGFLADAYTGRFAMVLFSSIVYLMGLILLTMSQFVPSLKPCGSTGVCTQPRKVHEAVFFLALYMISVGTGGHKPCLESFGADQFDDNHAGERRQKMSFFNWWNFGLCCGMFLSVTAIVYVEGAVGWGAADLIIAITMAISIVTFSMGRTCFRYRTPQGSPLTPMFQVFVAAIRKRKLHCPSDSALLYEVDKSQKIQGRLVRHTNRLGFLDKAAIVEEKDQNTTNNEEQHNPWKLATVTNVEEVKLILNTIPIWLTSLTFGLCLAQPATFFVKQAAATNLHITAGFSIPPASLYSVGAASMIATVVAYDRAIVPLLRKSFGNERGLNILQRIGLGMAISVLAMAVAALVEAKRLGLARNEAKTMSVLWLVPQFVIYGIADAFCLVGLQEYFYDQVPDSMRSLGIALYLSVIGVGSFLSSLSIYVVDNVTERINGRTRNGWIGKDLSTSRLDKFYWLLAVMSALNLCVYVFIARAYTYKSVERRYHDRSFVGPNNGVEDII